MSTNTISPASAARGLGTGPWRLDAARSSVVFHVRHLYGLMTVKGRSKGPRRAAASHKSGTASS
jgi:polyisoprenoid-binding protein YceI